MPVQDIGITVTTVGGIMGIIMIILGGFLYLIGRNNRVMIATTARTIGVGIMALMVSIPFSIPNHLIVESTSNEYSVFGVIILSVFLGIPIDIYGNSFLYRIKRKSP